ncbi:MAG: signal peptidase I [Lachnospiraceae bacterium]|nr:signal peptidase I [Lachnospiraceae bacterium]
MYRNEEISRVHKVLRSAVNWIVDIVMALILAVLAIHFYGDKVTMNGSSMKPVLESNDVVLLDELCYTFSEPERFDVVSFTVENNGMENHYVKRIIGLPGETVQIVDGLVLINGSCPDAENALYQAAVSGEASEPVLLGAGEYFVLGDNRASSEDSRFSNVGNVSFSQIEGRLWLLVKPFVRMGLIQ